MKLSLRGKLEQSRVRCEPFRKIVQEQYKFEVVPRLSLASESGSFAVLAMHDRYGFPVRLAMCRETGILYLMDRLSGESYSKFYESGLYRQLLSAYHGEKQFDMNNYLDQSQLTANAVANAIDHLIVFPPNPTMLDIGGSTGDVGAVFQERYGVRATILDPAEAELAIAAKRGMATKQALLEDAIFAPNERFDVIVLNQALEHLLDLRVAFSRIGELLNPDGYFIFDILDFLAEVEMRGTAETVSRLDHCHFFYDEMVDVLCARVGFRILGRIRHKRLSCLYICKKTPPDLSVQIRPEVCDHVLRTCFSADISWEKTPRVAEYSLEERLLRKLGRPPIVPKK